MIQRRELMTGGLLGGVLSALSPDASAEPAAAAAADVTDDMVNRIVKSLVDLRSEVQALRAFDELTPVRNAQLPFLRANGKFPDYLEVGVTVWFAVHDWHIRWQQPLNIGRDALNRQTIVLNQTTVILRTDSDARYVGLPYDGNR